MQKKLLVVIPYFYPKTGGLENYALNICYGLMERWGYNIVVITSNHLTKKETVDNYRGIKIYRLPISFVISNTPFNFSWIKRIKEIIQMEKPDVINAHTPVPFISDVARMVKGKIPFILTYQNDVIKNNAITSKCIRAYYKLVLEKTLQESHAIIVSSDYYLKISKYLSKHNNKIAVISPGVDINIFRPLQYAHRENAIVFIAQLDRSHIHKGLEILLASMKRLKLEQKSIKLYVVGNGNFKKHYEELAKEYNISENVIFLGHIENTKLVEILNNVKATILPSTNDSEGFGMVLIESMACGTPVIGTKVGGIPYVLGRDKSFGILIEPNNIEALASAIKELLNKANYEELSRNAVKQCVNNYNWNIQVTKTYNLIESILK